MNKEYEHDFDPLTEVCKKCNKPKNQLTVIAWNVVCPVVGKEEVAQFRNDNN